jgi:hypothetical protein
MWHSASPKIRIPRELISKQTMMVAAVEVVEVMAETMMVAASVENCVTI